VQCVVLRVPPPYKLPAISPVIVRALPLFSPAVCSIWRVTRRVIPAASRSVARWPARLTAQSREESVTMGEPCINITFD
jgi:hypothetical protein